MALSLSRQEVCRLRFRAQRLTHQSSGRSIPEVVQQLCGIQAQELPAAVLSLRPRTNGLLANAVEQARVVERSIVRVWGPRGTLHLLAATDLKWLLSLFGPVFNAGNKKRRVELGLDEEACTRGSKLLRNILAEHGPLTRAEIVAHLAAKGLRLEGQAVPHFLGYCALNGLLCWGLMKAGEPTYILLMDWLEDWKFLPASESNPYPELALRYLAAYSPAQPEDFASWSGLSLKEIRPAWKEIANQLLEVQIEQQIAWMLKTQADWLEELASTPLSVRLLPRYDTYLLGYRSRDFMVDTTYAKRINAGGGIIHPTIVVDGQVLGVWKTKKQKDGLKVLIEPFEPLTSEVQAGIEAEIQDLVRFSGNDK